MSCRLFFQSIWCDILYRRLSNKYYHEIQDEDWVDLKKSTATQLLRRLDPPHRWHRPMCRAPTWIHHTVQRYNANWLRC